MIVTIESEADLPAQERHYEYYVRSKIDPRFLISGWIGTVYQRADGKPWRYPAYDRRDAGAPLSPRSAWFDDAEYPYTTTQEKAA